MFDRVVIRWPLVAPMIPLVLIVLLYGQALEFAYVWDDSLLFLNKSSLMNEPLSWALLSEPVLPGTTYFRPLMFLTMYVEFQVTGQDPAISHAVNLCIFAGNALLIYFVTLRLARSLDLSSPQLRASLATVIYVIHPSLVESVAWISGRFDLMVTFFMLLGVYWSMLEIRRVPKVFLVCAAMMAGLLSKELAVVMPALVLCVWMARHGRDHDGVAATLGAALRSNAFLLSGMVLTFAFYMVLRVDAVKSVYHASITEGYIRLAWFEQRLPLEAVKFYLMHSFMPFYDISPMHPVSDINFASWTERLTAWAAGVFVVILFTWAFVKRSASSWLMIAWLACISPVLHLVPLSILDNIGHDRFLTAGLAFLVMAVVLVPVDEVLGMIRARARALAVNLTLAAWCVLALLTSISVIPLWASELRLWHWAYQDYPEINVVRYNYLYASLTDNRRDILVREVEKWLESGRGLEVGEQLLYANYLIASGDSEGEKYLEGVLYALPKFHDRPDGELWVNNFHLTAAQMGGAYGDYANAMMVFEADAERALEYNRIAEWYFQPSERVPMLYQRAAILYALNDFDAADALIEELKGLYQYKKEVHERGMAALVNKFCQVKDYKTVSCERLIERGLVSRVDGG